MVVSSSSVFSRISSVQYAQQCGTLTGFAMWSPDVHVCAIPGLIVTGSDHALPGLMACHTRVIVARRRESSDAVAAIARSLTTSATFTCHTQSVARPEALRWAWSPDSLLRHSGSHAPANDYALRGLMACYTGVIAAIRRERSDAVAAIIRSLTTSATTRRLGKQKTARKSLFGRLAK